MKILKNVNLIHYKVNILSNENKKISSIIGHAPSKNNHLCKVKKSNEIGYYPNLDYVMNIAPSIGNFFMYYGMWQA